MRAVDTNVLVRLLTRDDVAQVAAAEAFVAKGAWVSHLALAETIWVLGAVYGVGSRAIATTVEMLLRHEHLAMQDADVVAAALERFREKPAVSFTDCLVLEIARKAGHMPFGTFNRGLAKLAGPPRFVTVTRASTPVPVAENVNEIVVELNRIELSAS
jgi:predicted nucleic-acid-binding protein